MEHHFFAYINRMKFIQRWGLMRNTLPENDMEHALQTAMIAHAIAVMGNTRYDREYNAEYIMALAMYHDASEVITGDLPTPIKHHNPAIKTEYNKLEDIAAQKLLSMLPPICGITTPPYRPRRNRRSLENRQGGRPHLRLHQMLGGTQKRQPGN
jgi:5'-deoxynucleotidase